MELVVFQSPDNSSWAFIYPFVMLMKENCLSHPCLVHIQAFTSGQVCLHLAMQRVCIDRLLSSFPLPSVSVQR